MSPRSASLNDPSVLQPSGVLSTLIQDISRGNSKKSVRALYSAPSWMPILADVLLKGLERGTYYVRVNSAARGEPTRVSPTLRTTSPGQRTCPSGERESSVIGSRSVGVQSRVRTGFSDFRFGGRLWRTFISILDNTDGRSASCFPNIIL